MAFLDWQERFSVGIPSIDAQHQFVINLLNGMHEDLVQRKSKEIINAAFAGLIAHTAEHFTFEEHLFAEYQYIDGEIHAKEHTALIRDANAIKADVDSGVVDVDESTMVFLRSWIQNHILGTDLKFGPFLASKGVK